MRIQPSDRFPRAKIYLHHRTTADLVTLGPRAWPIKEHPAPERSGTWAPRLAGEAAFVRPPTGFRPQIHQANTDRLLADAVSLPPVPVATVNPTPTAVCRPPLCCPISQPRIPKPGSAQIVDPTVCDPAAPTHWQTAHCYVQPRRRKKISRIGMGMPINQRRIQPIFPLWRERF